MTKKKLVETIAKWSADKAVELWKGSSGEKQAKKFIKEYMPKFIESLLNKSGKQASYGKTANARKPHKKRKATPRRLDNRGPQLTHRLQWREAAWTPH